MFVLTLVSFVLGSLQPVLVMAGLIVAILVLVGLGFVIITTLQWLQDKDSLW
jgi:hypothetical protein